MAGPVQRARVDRQMRLLPRTVEPWMLFTNSGQMRRIAFQHGGFADEYHGWTITLSGPFYQARAGAIRSPRFHLKVEMYRWARDNSRTAGQA